MARGSLVARANSYQLPRGEQRSRFTVYVTEDELEILRLVAERDGLSLSRWVLQSALGVARNDVHNAASVSAALAELKNAIAELNKVGSNLNQLTRLANTNHEFPSGLDCALGEVRETVQELYDAYTRVEATRP